MNPVRVAKALARVESLKARLKRQGSVPADLFWISSDLVAALRSPPEVPVPFEADGVACGCLGSHMRAERDCLTCHGSGVIGRARIERWARGEFRLEEPK